MNRDIIRVNRAPVLTLWAAVVAERLGYDRDEAFSLGKALAGLNAQSKGRRLGIFKPAERPETARKASLDEELHVALLGRSIPAKNTAAGVRAINKGHTVEPAAVERYLGGKFGDRLGAVEEAMTTLARAFKPDDLAVNAFDLYERFRPAIPEGISGWGAQGELDLATLRSLAAKAQGPS